jgi:hypothetical protein
VQWRHRRHLGAAPKRKAQFPDRGNEHESGRRQNDAEGMKKLVRHRGLETGKEGRNQGLRVCIAQGTPKRLCRNRPLVVESWYSISCI